MGYIDIHSHILPGVDDGSRSLEQSLRMLRKAQEEGIDTMILTPHNKAEHKNVSVEGIHRRLHELKQAAGQERIAIELYPGNEIFYRDGVVELLDRGEVCTLAESRYVLVEFRPIEEFSYIRRAIYELAGNGYAPILAHVERYLCMADLENLRCVVGRGALVQVNAGSISGRSGLRVKHLVKKMLKERLVHFVATDAHDDEKRNAELANAAKYLYRKYGQEYADALLRDNAMRILKKEMIN